jgi:hypothetical protein
LSPSLKPRSSAELKSFLSGLEDLQEHSPELRVVIVGGVLEGRVAAFQYGMENQAIYYVIPYPE